MRPDDLLDRFEIDPAVAIAMDGNASEPSLVEGPILIEFDEAPILDPERAAADPEAPRPEAPPPERRRRMLAFGPVGSLAMHALPLLLLLPWRTPPRELPPAIAVRLVMQKPPAPPAPSARPPQPTGRLASIEMGEPTHAAKRGGDAVQPAEAKPKPPPPKPPPPKPPPPSPAALQPVPKPEPRRIAAAAPLRHRGRQPRVPGPSATRDEYLAYLVTLTRRHFNLLPLSFIGARRGETVLAIVVQADGTIGRIAVAHSSGYPDIDARIEKMVAAVHRFPPLPQWFQGPRIELNLRLRFPQALERR